MICGMVFMICLPWPGGLLAQDDDQDFGFLNPGIRVGYTFGSGFTVGFEMSIGVYNGAFAGASAGIDYTIGDDLNGNIFRVYLDAEAGLLLAGVGFGGALVLDDGEIDLGPQTTVFASWPVDSWDPDLYKIVVPYYRVTKAHGRTLKELGTFYKYSYPIGKGNYGTRWD